METTIPIESVVGNMIVNIKVSGVEKLSRRLSIAAWMVALIMKITGFHCKVSTEYIGEKNEKSE